MSHINGHLSIYLIYILSHMHGHLSQLCMVEDKGRFFEADDHSYTCATHYEMHHLHAAWLIHVWPIMPWLNYMRHDSHMCDPSCHDSCLCGMTHTCATHYAVTHLFVAWLITYATQLPVWHRLMTHSFIRDMTHLHMAWLTHMRHNRPAWHQLTTRSYVTWLIHEWHDSFTYGMTDTYATRLPVWHQLMTHSYVTWIIQARHDSFKCGMTHTYATQLYVW